MHKAMRSNKPRTGTDCRLLAVKQCSPDRKGIGSSQDDLGDGKEGGAHAASYVRKTAILTLSLNLRRPQSVTSLSRAYFSRSSFDSGY